MQIAHVALSSRHILAAVAALLIVLIGWTATGAQDAPMYRFFGFAGDVTVDGEPISPGTVIAASINGEEVGRSEVNAAGAWVLDVESEDFDQLTCNITFEVEGLQARQPQDDCSLRVRLAFSSDDPTGGSLAAADQAVEDEELTQAGPVVRPVPPRTGAGGLAEDEAATNWPRTAAITAVLTLGAALVALLIGRRSDNAA